MYLVLYMVRVQNTLYDGTVYLGEERLQNGGLCFSKDKTQ